VVEEEGGKISIDCIYLMEATRKAAI